MGDWHAKNPDFELEMHQKCYSTGFLDKIWTFGVFVTRKSGATETRRVEGAKTSNFCFDSPRL